MLFYLFSFTNVLDISTPYNNILGLVTTEKIYTKFARKAYPGYNHKLFSMAWEQVLLQYQKVFL